jgi:hypothetical protein
MDTEEKNLNEGSDLSGLDVDELNEKLAAKRKEFEAMTQKNLNNMLMGIPEAYPAAAIVKISEEIKKMESRISELLRSEDNTAANKLEMDKGMMDKLKSIDPRVVKD